MRFAYTTLSFMAGLVFISISLFNFVEDNDEKGKRYLLLAIMVFLGTYYLLKSLYYLRHQATFNEISFVVFLPVLIGLQAILKQSLSVVFDRILEINIDEMDAQLYVALSLFEISLIPYFIASLFLLMRTSVRYPFIRYTGYSEGGLPTRLISLVLTLGIPILYLIIGILFETPILFLFAMIYGLVGFLSWFV